MANAEEPNPNHSMSDQGLRRAVSDVLIEMNKIKDYEHNMVEVKEVEKVECKCCGIVEDCTQNYINHVRDTHCGEWVCGLCSEAVKEQMMRAQSLNMEEAMSIHIDYCLKFNTTTRVNPKLSLAWTMRDIAKKRSQQRSSKGSKIGRRSSCMSAINLD